MPRAAIAFVITFVVGLGALLLVGIVERRGEAFTLGVTAAGPIKVKPGDRLCQTPIEATEAFDAVRMKIGTYRRPGSPFEVEVGGPSGRPTLGRGRQATGYADNDTLSIPIGHVDQGERVAVCLHNVARQPIAVYGNAAVAHLPSNAFLNGKDTGADASIVFLRSDRVSLISLLPAAVDRMSLFHGGWVDPWLVWLILTLVLIVVPGTLALGLLRARP